MTENYILAIATLLASVTAWADGSIQQHLTLDVEPLAISANVPIGSGAGFSYNRLHGELKTTYVLTGEFFTPWQSGPTGANRTDVLASAAFLTEITPAFSIGARLGALVNNQNGMLGFGGVALRLPALHPTDKEFFSFFYEEVDLGISGVGSAYASFRLGMLLL